MRLRCITWGLYILDGDFMSYTKLLSWLLCFIASFPIHPPNKQKRICSRGTTSTRWTMVGINLPIIPCFEKIQLQILWSFVTKWMHTKDKFYPGSWRCNLIYYWKKKKNRALTVLLCKGWGYFPCVQTYYAWRVAARIIYSWVIFRENV